MAKANVIQDLSRYLELLLEKQSAGVAYTALWNEKNVMVGLNGMPNYNDVLNGVPNVCFKVPTGGGKTFLACNSINSTWMTDTRERISTVPISSV